MGMDHDFYRGDCPCGRGIIEVEHVSTDHAWSSGGRSDWYPALLCETCSKVYEFMGLKLVRRDEAATLRIWEERRQQERGQPCEEPGVNAMRAALASVLDAMPSNAARHRWLIERRLEHSTYATFSKHWRNGMEWTQCGVHYHNVVDVAGHLGIDCAPIRAEMDRLRKEAESAPDEPPPEVHPVITGLKFLAA